MSQKNVEVVRQLWDAAERRDSRAVFALYDPAIVWESPQGGALEVGGRYDGHEGVRRFFRDWLESFEDYEAKAETFMDAGNEVLVGYRVSGRGKGSGVEVEMLRWNVYGLRDDRVVRVEVFETEADAREAAGLRD